MKDVTERIEKIKTDEIGLISYGETSIACSVGPEFSCL